MKRLREIRIKHKLTQAEVGKILGVAQNTVSTWESGRTEPDISKIKALAKLFKMPIEKLID